MAVTPAFEMTVERKPMLPHLPPTTIGENVDLTMTSIVISATVTLQAREVALLDGAELGFVQADWVHRYWSRYEGANVSDGSTLIDQVAPGEYDRIVYTDTVLQGQLFYGPPDRPFAEGIPPADLGDYGVFGGLPSSTIIGGSGQKNTTIRLAMGDKTSTPITTSYDNRKTDKVNVLVELYMQQEFYAGLVIRERSGNTNCFGFVHWWQSYHYNEQWNQPITAATRITHVAQPVDTYIRVGVPTKGPPKDPAFHRALIVPSPISATQAAEDSRWSAVYYVDREAIDHIPRPPPFGMFS